MTSGGAPAVQTMLDDSGLTLTLPNDMGALAAGATALREFLQQRGLAERPLYDAELVFEEMVTNTIRHGYPGPGGHAIEVRVGLSDDQCLLTFDDDAQAFDPTAAAAPVLPDSIEDAKIGGLGIMLVKKVASTMQYQRLNGRNTLRVSIPRA